MARSILSAPAAAKVVNVHVTTLLAWARAGKLGKAAIKVSDHVTVYDRDELVKWMQTPKRTGFSMDSEAKHAWTRSNVLSLAKRVKFLESAVLTVLSGLAHNPAMETLTVQLQEIVNSPVGSDTPEVVQ
jgi:hypothetical protein